MSKLPRGAKAAALRRVLAEHPQLPPREIADLLTGQGIPTTPQQVSTFKSQQQARAANRAAQLAQHNGEATIAQLLLAHRTAARLGGPVRALMLIDALAALSPDSPPPDEDDKAGS